MPVIRYSFMSRSREKFRHVDFRPKTAPLYPILGIIGIFLKIQRVTFNDVLMSVVRYNFKKSNKKI